MKWHSFRSTFLLFGFCLALIMVILFINCTSEEHRLLEYVLPAEEAEIIEQTPRTIQTKKTKKLPDKIKLSDLVIPEEVAFTEEPILESSELDETIFDEESIDETPVVTESTRPKTPPTPLPEVEDNAPVIHAERMPTLSDCSDLSSEAERKTCTEKSLMQTIYKNLSYPAIARENGVEGTVVVQFIVGKSGKMEEVKILRDIGVNCGDAAYKAVLKADNWEPGYQNGRPVRVMYTIPIKFVIE